MKTRQIGRRQDGQALVEFAFVTPVLLLLVLGIIQFGILFNNYITLTDAVRAGARQAAVSRTLPDPVGVTTTRVRRSAAGLDASKLTITVAANDPNGPPGNTDWVQGGDVTVAARYPFSINLLGFVVKSGKLKAETTERVE
jgi:Flp pilus assembly protein TadG